MPGSAQRLEPDHNAMPDGLDAAGRAAHAAIMEVLRADDATYTGGCKSFYSPAEWQARREKYGCGSKPIVVYDGGALRPYFNMDADDGAYSFTTKMQTALGKVGLYAEECTGWYAAIYRVSDAG